ncbi:MAG TPA: arsenate reductase family protein [Spirochaetota bacterium]|nr:arsenate reductase family protein [Spirochaetota bacterium]
MIKFYGYKKCGTSKKGEKALQNAGVDYTFIDITEKPPAKAALKKMIQQSGEPATKFFNTSGVEYKSQNLKDKLKDMSEKDMIELLASNGKLIKRPLVTDGAASTVGFKEEVFLKTWK